MTAKRDIVVVGGGVFGTTAALELAHRRWRVRLVDRGAVPHADASSTDVSKMIRMDYGADVFYHELAEVSLEGWERWNHDWPRPLYHPEGFLILSAGPMRPGGFEYESHRVLLERGYSPGRLTAATLARRFPKWRPERYPDGYVSPRGGWAESGAVVAHLAELCREAGVEMIEATVAGLASRGSHAAGVEIQARPTAGGAVETLSADHVLVCAGAWTPELLPETAGLLTPVAQPVLHFGVEDPDEYRGPSFPPFAADIAGSGWYGFPALSDGRLKLGHHGPGRVAPPDGRGVVGDDHVRKARAFLAAALPSLADAPLVGSRVCMYCDSRDGDLLIAGLPGAEALTVASGGSGHGFKFAPALGGIIADAVEGRTNRWLPRFAWRSPSSDRKEEARLLTQIGKRRMKFIHTEDAPQPAGHYSQAVVYGGVVYVAGMLGHDPANPDADIGGPAEQARQALKNVESVLTAAGSSLSSVVRMTIYVSDVEHWGPVNQVYAEVMGDHKPARAIVPVKSFRDPYVLEIVATAALGR